MSKADESFVTRVRQHNGLEEISESALFKKPPSDLYVSDPEFEELQGEELDIIRVQMIPVDVAFDEEGDEILQVREPAEDEKKAEPVKRRGAISAEEILAEAEAFSQS